MTSTSCFNTANLEDRFVCMTWLISMPHEVLLASSPPGIYTTYIDSTYKQPTFLQLRERITKLATQWILNGNLLLCKCKWFFAHSKANKNQTTTGPAPVALLVECPLRGTGGHGFDPGPRHTKVIKNGTSCSSLVTQPYGVELSDRPSVRIM